MSADMNTREVMIDPIMLMGISIRTSNANESNSDTALIPGLWQQYFSENIDELIVNKKQHGSMFGVYTQYDTDHSGEYTLYAGCEVDQLNSLSDNLHGIEIPRGKYLVFNKEGDIPDIIYQLWQEIWDYFAGNDNYKRAYTFDFERYDSANASKLEIFIAIE